MFPGIGGHVQAGHREETATPFERSHFPTEQAALKCLYRVTRSLDPTGKGRVRWAARWKPALNALAITFSNRFPGTETYK